LPREAVRSNRLPALLGSLLSHQSDAYRQWREDFLGRLRGGFRARHPVERALRSSLTSRARVVIYSLA